MKKTIKILFRTVKWIFIVLCVYLGSLFFREEHVPGVWVESLAERFLPGNMLIHVDSVSIGFRRGLHIYGFRLFDAHRKEAMKPVVSASSIDYYPILRRLRIVDLKYARLPDSYYDSGNAEKNARVDCIFPDMGSLKVTLIRPDILAIRAERLDLEVKISPSRIDFANMHLTWPDLKASQAVDGFCYVDLDRQEVYGEIDGVAKQEHIRPMLVSIDVPVALPYMDGFTEVAEPCKSWCAWKVNLVNNDFDLWLDLHPVLGRYNTVPMRKADGKIHLHNYTRGDCLNYRTEVGPISAVDRRGRKLDGTVVITGTNRYNVVDVDAKSLQPLADVLKIGGFTGDYVGGDVIGDATCRLQFRFPRARTNNYEVMNGFGHVVVKDGQLMRLKGFQGLIEAMPSIAPAVTWFSDSTQASCDYVIENGVIRVDKAYVEGTMFSIMMYGWLDTVRNVQDFTVRVQFAKKDSMVGKVLHPLAWPFTKLLLEFRLTGSPEVPKWTYLSVIERVWEAVK